MRKIFVLIWLLMLGNIGMSQEENATEAYMMGIYDGYALGTSFIVGQSSPEYAARYDGFVVSLNAWMDRVGYAGDRWASHTKTAPAFELPPIFRDTQKPLLEVNDTLAKGGIVHEIDGMSKMSGPTYTTNDLNLLPDSARYNASTGTYSDMGGQWLAGI